MGVGNILIAALVEDDGGVVAVVDDGIAHELGAVLPAASFDIFLGIAGWHGLDEAYTVARLDVLFPGGDVHPTHEVAATLHHLEVAVVAEPGGYAHAYAGPLVAGALGIAVNHEHAVVEAEEAVGKLGLAESSAGGDLIDALAADDEAGLHGIEIAVTPTPEVEAAERLGGTECGGGTGGDVLGSTAEGAEAVSVVVDKLYLIDNLVRFTALVLHLRAGYNLSTAALHVDVFGIDVYAGGAEVGIEGQRLIETVGDVQAHMLG